MNERAQAGLDYLINYGWALILIASLVGVLAFLLYPESTEFECKVSDQRDFLFEGITGFSFGQGDGVEFWNNGRIGLQNISGGKITITEIKKDGYLYGKPSIAGVPCSSVNNEVPVLLGDRRKFEITSLEISFSPELSVPESDCDLYLEKENFFDKTSGKIYLSFTDEEGLPNQITIECSGFPPKTE
jgi:hypothetical protein